VPGPGIFICRAGVPFAVHVPEYTTGRRQQVQDCVAGRDTECRTGTGASAASNWSSRAAIETVAGSLSRGPAASAEARVWFLAGNVVMCASFLPGIILGRKDVNSVPTIIFSSTGSNV
jgi:hypothetical protein